MLSFSYHKVEKGVAMIVKVALRNGYNVYGRVVEENSSSIRLVAQRELIPEMRIAHIRCSKDIGETIVIDRSQVVETEEVSYDEMEFVGEPETKWSFWLGFSEHLSDDQLEPEITQYDEGPVQNSVEEEASDKILKNTKEEDLEEELDNGIDF
jgi:hypothetical protein